MLHINKIIIKNFRPYYGVKLFDFGEQDGLSVVLGDNGIGKSSLIRAIKFVLYDELDSLGDFKIKNELNIVAWEEENYEMYVSLSFKYNDDNYDLKRVRRPKAFVHGVPASDNDFEGTVTLIKNSSILSTIETNNVLKNIIPKKISEYILFEGETISKYKDLLDNNKNLEIYESIRKILGITTLENSKYDLEKQLEKYTNEKNRLIKEQTKNQGLLNDLKKFSDEISQYKGDRAKALEELEKTKTKKKEYEDILRNNQRIRDLLDNKSKQKEELKGCETTIDLEKENVKRSLRNYKSFCYEFIKTGITDKPANIIGIEQTLEINKKNGIEIGILAKLLTEPRCLYCGHDIHDHEMQDIRTRLSDYQKAIIPTTDEDIQLVNDYQRKIDTLRHLIDGIPASALVEREIRESESKIQSGLIEKDRLISLIRDTQTQIENMGGTKNIEQVAKSFGIAEKNEKAYQKTIEECDSKIKELQTKITDIQKKNPKTLNMDALDGKINTTKKLVEVFDSSIGVFSEEMRKKVQIDATQLFRQISENKEYDSLEFDEHYGLKLIDRNGRFVPNVSSGYMTLITISLIYGLHKNSSLTGTIILDAPFSVLTNFHRDNIISAFQTLSPQVLLLVYRDQIDLKSIKTKMQGKLINELEIYQDRAQKDSSYKTQIRGIEKWQN